MSKGIKILYVLPVAVCLLWSSCIRDSIPPCPPLQVTLTVKDKNYFNIDDAVKYGAQNETYIEGWEKKTSKLLIYKRLCKI